MIYFSKLRVLLLATNYYSLLINFSKSEQYFTKFNNLKLNNGSKMKPSPKLNNIVGYFNNSKG